MADARTRHQATVQCDTSDGQCGPRRKRNNQGFSGRPSTRKTARRWLNDKASRAQPSSAAVSAYACKVCGMSEERLRRKSTCVFTSIRRWQSGQDVPIKNAAAGSLQTGVQAEQPWLDRPARGSDSAHEHAICRFGNSLTCALKSARCLNRSGSSNANLMNAHCDLAT